MYTNPKDVREKKVEKFSNTPMTWIVILIIIILLGLVVIPLYSNYNRNSNNPLFGLTGVVSETSPLEALTNTPI
jgi:hypothetical protein